MASFSNDHYWSYTLLNPWAPYSQFGSFSKCTIKCLYLCEQVTFTTVQEYQIVTGVTVVIVVTVVILLTVMTVVAIVPVVTDSSEGSDRDEKRIGSGNKFVIKKSCILTFLWTFLTILTFLLNSRTKIKTQIATKLNSTNCDKTQKN